MELVQTQVVERWKPIPGYPHYEVSDQGRVRSLDRIIQSKAGWTRLERGKLFNPSIGGAGYRQVTLRSGGKQKTREVHVLVMEAFVGARPTGLEVCHWNGNCLDNRLSNLRYDTPAANCADKLRTRIPPISCRRGHLYDDANTYMYRGRRRCRACHALKARTARAKRKASRSDLR